MSTLTSPGNPGRAAPAKETSSDTLILALLALCFVLSGFAALVYQTAWTRQFALIFGTSELAVATVLAAYMGGLAIGAWVIERFLPRVQRPVRVYAIVEVGIALSAVVLVPACLWASRWLLVQWFGGQPEPPSSEQVGTSMFYLASAFVALAVPTILMGATLPLLARHAIREREQIGQRIGLLYASNTAGAVLGALGGAFLLLPTFGLTRTVWVAAAFNLVVFLLAVWLVQRENELSSGGTAAAPAAPAERVRFPFGAPPSPAWILPIMLLSGAVSFAHEVLWARMLAHIVGSSIYAFGVMVASFLAGIALGGAAGAWLARSRSAALNVFVVSQLAVAAWGAAAFLLLEHFLPERAGLFGNVAFGFLLLLPLTFAIGLTYPLAVRILADRAVEAAPASARVYTWNTFGAIAGALAAGFLIIPALRYEGTIQVLVLTSAVLALAALLLVERRAWVLTGAVAAATVAALVLFRPAVPQKLLLTSPLNLGAQGEVLFYDVGRSASVVVLAQDGGLALRTNGLPEALMDSPGTAPRFSGEFWMSSLAVIARPGVQNMLVVGYGGGVVVEGVPPSVRSVDVIELESEVIEANRATRDRRKFDPLIDPRVRVVTNDARGALALTDKRYDAVVSQPSHPWTSGASHLYTREFMQEAKVRMNPGGVFVQWMNVAFLDEELLRSLTATMIDVFGEVRIYRPDPSTLVFVASDRPFDIERRLLTTGNPIALAPLHYGRYGINTPEDLITALAVDENGARRLAEGAALITDDRNRMATSSVYELARGLTPDATGRALAPYDPLQQPDSWIYREIGSRVDFGYVARRMAFFRVLDQSILDRARRMRAALGNSASGAYVQAYFEAAVNPDPQIVRRLASELLALHPEDSRLRFLVLQQDLPAIGRGETTPEMLESAARLPPSAQAVLQGTQFLLAGNFDGLARLDRVLASARWTDPWFGDAWQLRAEWRSRVSNPELTRALADEAIRMVDQLAVVQPSLALFAIRARAALNAERPAVLVESVWNVAQWSTATAGPTPEGRQRARATLQELVKLLDDTRAVRGADSTRLAEVRTRIDEAIKTLS